MVRAFICGSADRRYLLVEARSIGARGGLQHGRRQFVGEMQNARGHRFQFSVKQKNNSPHPKRLRRFGLPTSWEAGFEPSALDKSLLQ